LGAEVTHLAGDAAGELFGVEAGDRADSGTALRQGLPVLLDACPERSDQAETSDGDAAPLHVAVVHGRGLASDGKGSFRASQPRDISLVLRYFAAPGGSMRRLDGRIT